MAKLEEALQNTQASKIDNKQEYAEQLDQAKAEAAEAAMTVLSLNAEHESVLEKVRLEHDQAIAEMRKAHAVVYGKMVQDRDEEARAHHEEMKVTLALYGGSMPPSTLTLPDD